MRLVSHPLSLIKDKLYVLSFPLPTTPPGRLLPSKHAPVRGWYWHGTGSTNTARPTIGGTGTKGAPYIYRTGCTRGNVRAPHHVHTVPRTGPIPFCPYRPRTVLPPCCHYKPLPTRTAPVPFCPYRPRTVLSSCCPYKPLLLFLSSLLLFCLDAFPSQQVIPKVKIRDGVNGCFTRILHSS